MEIEDKEVKISKKQKIAHYQYFQVNFINFRLVTKLNIRSTKHIFEKNGSLFTKYLPLLPNVKELHIRSVSWNEIFFVNLYISLKKRKNNFIDIYLIKLTKLNFRKNDDIDLIKQGYILSLITRHVDKIFKTFTDEITSKLWLKMLCTSIDLQTRNREFIKFGTYLFLGALIDFVSDEIIEYYKLSQRIVVKKYVPVV